MEVAVLDDGEPSSEGEMRFLGAADELWTELSVLAKARTGETVPLVGLPWTLEPELDANDELTVAFTVYAEDADALARLDRVEQRYAMSDGWGLGEHVMTSPDERFRVRYAIAPATDDGLTDLPGLVPLLVEFTEVRVHDDGDPNKKGDVSCAGIVNGVTVLETLPGRVDDGESIALGAPFAPRTLWLSVPTRTSRSSSRRPSATAADRRAGHQPSRPRRIRRLGPRRPGGPVRQRRDHRHVARRPRRRAQGAREVPPGPRVRRRRASQARGLHLRGLGQRRRNRQEPADEGGQRRRLERRRTRSDIDWRRWTKTVSYDPDDPQLDIRFTLTELDGRAEDLLGTVTVDASDAFGGVNGMRVYTQLADSGKFELTFLAAAVA